jgi:hypothetical protein
MFKVFWLFITSATCAVAASAQTGSPARNTQEVFDVRNKERDYFEHAFRNSANEGPEAYSNAISFASCTARLNAAATAKVLSFDAGSKLEDGAMRDLSKHYGTCAIKRTSTPPIFVRAAIAEVLWKQAGADANPAKRSSVEIEAVEIFIKTLPLGEQKTKVANLPLSWVSRCQVMALPTEAARVLATNPGSLEEKAAAEVLYAKSNVCGVVGGLEKTPSLLVRAGLADAFYQDSRRVSLASTK